MDFFVIISIIWIVIIRFLGSWMLRINDVINYQKELVETQKTIIQELKRLNTK